MKKLLGVLSLTGFIIFVQSSCSKEAIDLKLRDKGLAFDKDSLPQDSIPHDTIPHDSIPHDTIIYPPHDTLPHDTFPYPPLDTFANNPHPPHDTFPPYPPYPPHDTFPSYPPYPPQPPHDTFPGSDTMYARKKAYVMVVTNQVKHRYSI